MKRGLDMVQIIDRFLEVFGVIVLWWVNATRRQHGIAAIVSLSLALVLFTTMMCFDPHSEIACWAGGLGMFAFFGFVMYGFFWATGPMLDKMREAGLR